MDVISVKLSSLEITNFKSFVHLCLNDLAKSSLYAIVGMNGTGKSNIIDAFLYVLGENRTQNLRIRRFADLIHGNSSHSSGATSCTVKLKVQTNTNERILFERTTMKNGPDSYRINDVTIARHSDYLERLHVIGVKTTVQNYFILQGNIQDVASMSDKNMTRFMERICGSIEFRKEHERALKKHAEAVEIMMQKRAAKNRLGKHEKKARKQAELFIKSIELKNQLEEKRVIMALFMNCQLTQQINDFITELEAKGQQLCTLEQQKKSLEDELSKIPLQENAEAQNIREMNKELTTLEHEFEVITTKIARLKQDLCSNTGNDKNINKNIDESEKLQKKGNEDLKMYEAKLKKLEEAEKLARDNLQETASDEAKKDYDAIKQRIERENSPAMNMKLRVRKVQMDIKQLQLKHLKEHLELASNNRQLIVAKCNDLKSEIQNQNGLLTLYEAEVPPKIKDVQSNIAKVYSEVSNIQETIFDIETFLFRADQQVHAVDEDLSTRCAGVIGRLRDLVTAKSTKRRHQSVIFAKLSDNLQDIVADSLYAATRCSIMLGLSDKDTEHFLIVPKEPVDIPLLNGNIPHSDVLSNVLENEAAVRVVVDQVQDAIIVEDVDSARVISRELGRRNNTIAKNGRCYDKDGHVVVNLPLPKGKNGTKQEIDTLLTKIDSLVDTITVYEKQMNDIELQAEVRVKRLKVNQDLVFYQSKLEVFAKELQQQDVNFDNLKEKLSAKEKEIDQLKETDNSDLRQFEDELFEAFCRKHGFKNINHFETIAFAKNRAKQQVELDDITSKKEDCNKMITTTRNRMANRVALTLALKTKLTEVKNEKGPIEEDLKHNQRKELKLLEKIGEKRALKAAQETSGVEQRRGVIINLQRQLAQMVFEIESLKDAKNNVQFKMDSVRGSRDYHLQQCIRKNIILPMREDDSNEYDYELIPLALYREMSTDDYHAKVQELEAEILRIETDIKNLGPTNPAAAEERAAYEREYKEAALQFQECSTRVNDARQDVDELHNQRSACLTTCLQHLSVTLDRIYKELMKSQTACAQILAIDPERPYSGGISYMCAVPNKTFHRIWDLSSGEKSMAALALYFALREYKPAPLFLLDEIDSRLDAKNSLKLANFLRVHRREGLQTFVVTHKPIVAAGADELVSIAEREKMNQLEQRILKMDLNEFPE